MRWVEADGACGGGKKYIYTQDFGGRTRMHFKEFGWEGVDLVICHRTVRGDGLL